MKRALGLVVLGLCAAAAQPALAIVSGECADLMADGGSAATAVKAGEVCVSNVGTNLTVTFTTTDWCMTQTHLQVASSPGGIPQKNGNPLPGKFQYAHTLACATSDTYTVPLAGGGGEQYIAAHAVVWDEASDTPLNVVSDTSIPIVEVNGSTVAQFAVLANKPLGYPNCSTYTENTLNSAWDSGIGSYFTDTFADAGARWIWDAAHPLNPRAGDVVTFQQAFTVPGLPISATLLATADNAFKVEFNGSFVGNSISLGPDFPTTLREQVAAVPQDGLWGVASQGWQTVESFNLNVVSGQNTLKITAANEYMCNSAANNCLSGADNYLGWGGNDYTSTIFPDPLPGDGAGVYPCYNPGGLIFLASVRYYARSETGWGAGTGFSGSSWATYITYTPTTVTP